MMSTVLHVVTGVVVSQEEITVMTSLAREWCESRYLNERIERRLDACLERIRSLQTTDPSPRSPTPEEIALLLGCHLEHNPINYPADVRYPTKEELQVAVTHDVMTDKSILEGFDETFYYSILDKFNQGLPGRVRVWYPDQDCHFDDYLIGVEMAHVGTSLLQFHRLDFSTIQDKDRDDLGEALDRLGLNDRKISMSVFQTTADTTLLETTQDQSDPGPTARPKRRAILDVIDNLTI